MTGNAEDKEPASNGTPSHPSDDNENKDLKNTTKETVQKIASSPKPTTTLKKKYSVSKQDLWKDAISKTVDNNNDDGGEGPSVVQMLGHDNNETHTAYARVASGPPLSIGRVLDVVVDEVKRHVIQHDILREHRHVRGADEYPPSDVLLHLGAVWLLNETAWTTTDPHHHHKHDASHNAHRVSPERPDTVTPDWNDMTLRVHYVPDRFLAAHDVDWSKYCRGRLVGGEMVVRIGDESPHVPVAAGLMPDAKDGVVVYEDFDLGFAVVNKPSNLPVHATLSNHREDVVSLFRQAWQERRPDRHTHKLYVHAGQHLDMDTSGLLCLSTKPEFDAYWNEQLLLLSQDNKKKRHHNNNAKTSSVSRTFKCLVCVQDVEGLNRLERLQQSGTIVTHYMNDKTKKVVRHVSKTSSSSSNNNKHSQNHHHHDNHWHQCQMRIVQVGDASFRAACVQSVYPDSADVALAHRLWGPVSSGGHPPPASSSNENNKEEETKVVVQYVTELLVELRTFHKHQLSCQLAALGFPVVGDEARGGGRCERHSGGHAWNRMALQCCELVFCLPQRESEDKLVPSEDGKMCAFQLRRAWWSEYLQQYEMYHQSY